MDKPSRRFALSAKRFLDMNLRDVVLAGDDGTGSSEADREASPSGERQVEGLFESLLAQSFGE